MVDEQADVEELRPLPRLVVQRLGAELSLEALDALPDPLVVEADPLADGLLRPGPVRVLEAPLRQCARLAEQPVVLVEALDHRVRDLLRDV